MDHASFFSEATLIEIGMSVLLADRTFYRTKVSATEYVTVGPIRNRIKFFLAAFSDTLHFFLSTLIGSLSNYDDDHNHDFKKTIGLMIKTTALHVHHVF